MTTIVKGGDYIIEGYPDSIVEVLATDMGGRWSVLVRHKYFQSSDDWFVGLTEGTGEFRGPFNLIPRPPRTVKRKVWINWYESGTHMLHLDKDEAEKWGSPTRIAFTEHELDVPEGVKL